MQRSQSSEVKLTKETFRSELSIMIEKIFSLSEMDKLLIRGNVLTRDGERTAFIQEAVESSYHDCYSDIDMTIVVKLNWADRLSLSEYLKHSERYGLEKGNCLGLIIAKTNDLYRVVLKNGMRFDMIFQFVYENGAELLDLPPVLDGHDHPSWPMAKINEFWFVQVQALGKLYRRDYLIADHLANTNINETLVQQMVLRDMQYGTNHHRYGYEDKIAYLDSEFQCPGSKADEGFCKIADKLYRAALAYDDLTAVFYPESERRSGYFFEIWKCYEQFRMCGQEMSNR